MIAPLFWRLFPVLGHGFIAPPGLVKRKGRF
jgi:hypothetical protein